MNQNCTQPSPRTPAQIIKIRDAHQRDQFSPDTNGDLRFAGMREDATLNELELTNQNQGVDAASCTHERRR
jgi:hypothetical protein